MDLSTLGYTDNWINFDFLSRESLEQQLREFATGEDPHSEHYRYRSFQQWLAAKDKVTNQEIDHYLELAKADPDQRMAGSALTDLFESSILSDGQFQMIKLRLPDFGDWTNKLIRRASLNRRLQKETITQELYEACLQYKKDYKDNRLLFTLIRQTDNHEILAAFATNGSGKQLRKLAEKKLKKISKK